MDPTACLSLLIDTDPPGLAHLLGALDRQDRRACIAACEAIGTTEAR